MIQGFQFNGYGPSRPQFSHMPPVIAARMEVWNNKKKPTLDALQEAGDYLWQVFDRGLLDVKLEPQLETDVLDLQSLKRNMHPDKWEKVEEEWQELLAEVPEVNPKELEAFHVKGEHDTAFSEPHWVKFLAALGWPYIPIQKFMEFERLKIDGRLRYQAANPDIPKETRKASLKPYETQAAKFVFGMVG